MAFFCVYETGITRLLFGPSGLFFVGDHYKKIEFCVHGIEIRDELILTGLVIKEYFYVFFLLSYRYLLQKDMIHDMNNSSF